MEITQNITLINQLDDKYIISQTRTMRAFRLQGASRFQLGLWNEILWWSPETSLKAFKMFSTWKKLPERLSSDYKAGLRA